MASSVNIGTLSGVLAFRDETASVLAKFEARIKAVEASISKTQRTTKNETEKINEAYKKVAASLDPAVARTQKYEQQVEVLSKALKAGVISQSQYNHQLDLAKGKLQQAEHWTGRLGRSIGSELVGNFTRFFAVSALISVGIGSIVSVTRQLIQANIDAEASERRVEESVRRYGLSSGVTVDQINDLASAQSRLTGIDDEVIADAEAMALKYNRIGTSILPQVTQAALDLSAATGQDLSSAMEKVGKLVNQPLKALTLLAREGYAVGESQSKLIKDLLATGRVSEAQAQVLKILESQYGGAAVAARDTMGGAIKALQTTWENFLERVGQDNMGPLRSALESVIRLLEFATDGIKYVEIGFHSSRAAVNGFISDALGGFADLIDTITNAAGLLGRFGIGVVAIGEEVSSRARNAADVAGEDAVKHGMKAAMLLADLDKGHKRGTGSALEQTEAESKLGEEIDKVSESITLAIEAMQRRAENAKNLWLAATIGVKAYNAEVLRQKVVAAILQEENKLREKGGKLTEVQRNAIAEATINEDLFNRKLKETLALNEKLISTALTATDNIAGKGFAADFKRFIDDAHRGMELIQVDVEEMLGGLAKIQDLDLEIEFNSRLMDVEPHLRDVEADYLSFLESIGSGFERAGENAITAGERILQTLAERFGKTIDEVRADLALLSDIDLAVGFKDSLRTDGGLKGLRTTLERLQTTTDKTGKSLLSAAEAQEVYTRALAKVVEETLDAAANLLTQIAGITGSKSLGQAGSILGAAGGAVGASNTYSQNPSMMAAMGAVGAWLSLFITMAETFTDKGGIHYGADIKSGGLGNLETGGAFTYVKGALHEAEKAAKEIADTIENIVQSFGGQLQSIRTFSIVQTGEGWAASFGGEMRRYFTEFSDAVAWAAHEAISTADVSGISDEILEAFRNYTFRTLEDLQEFSTYAREYTSYGASELTGNLRGLTDWFIESSRKAYEYGLSIAKVSEEFGRRAQSWRDQVLGIVRSPEEQVHQNVVDFNAWIDQQRLSAQIQIDAAGAQMTAAQMQMNAAWAELKASGMADSDPETRALFLESQRLFKDAAARLDMWTRALNNLPPAITPEEEDAAKKRARKGGGGGGNNKQDTKDWIQDRKFELDNRGVDEYRRSVLEKEREYQDKLAEVGKKDKGLRTEIIALRERELALMAQERMDLVQADYSGFVDQSNAFRDVRETVSALIKSINDSPFGDPDKASMIANVLAELEEQIESLSLQEASGLFSGLISDMERYGASEAQMSGARKHLAIIEHTLNVINYRTRFEILKAEGKVAKEILASLDASIKFVEGIDPTKFINASRGEALVSSEWMARQSQDMETSVDSTIGDLERLRESFRKAKDSILETVLEFDRGEFGAVTPEMAWAEASRQFGETVANAQAGSLEAFESAPEAFKNALDVLKEFSPALYASESFKLRDKLAGLGTLNTVKEGNLIITDFERKEQHAQTVQTLNNGFSDLSGHATQQEGKLDQVLTELRISNTMQRDLDARLIRLESGRLALK